MIAILCPGPSLTASWDNAMRSSYRTVVAVNRAAELGCDWWFCADFIAFSKWEVPQPRVGLAGRVASYLQGIDRPPFSGLHLLSLFDMGRDLSLHPEIARFTTPQAIYFAGHHLGAREIHLFGADMAGDQDFRGDTAGRRDGERWSDEWCEVRNACDLLSHITVQRKMPCPI